MIEKWWLNSRPILLSVINTPSFSTKSIRTKRKKRRTSQMAGTTLCVLYFRGARPLYLCLTRRFSQGQGDRGSRKSYSHTLLHNPAPAAFGGAGTFPHSRRGLQSKCSWRPIPGLPPCVTAFRLVCRSFCFADKVLLALYHTPPPIKNQGVWARFVDTHKSM